LGGYEASVTDAPMAEVTTYWRADGVVRADGTRQADAIVRRHYGQFDVLVGFDLMSAESLTELSARVRRAVEGFRDAGTRMRQIAIEGRTEDRAGASSDAVTLATALTERVDVRPAIRLQADGSVLVGEAIPLTANGQARADGTLMASGYTVGGTPPAADDDVSLMSVEVATDVRDSYAAPVLADGAIFADGSASAAGKRDFAIDAASITATRSWRANGLHSAGDGAVVANGNDRADGVRRCGAEALTAIGSVSSVFSLI